MAKRVERIDDPERVPEYVARAFATAMNGRPGPVVVVLPEDMLVREVTARPVPRIAAVQAWCDPGGLRQLREMLLAAKKPFVIAGGSGWTPQSAQALQRFAENWKLPVGNAFRFQDTFDNHHPQYAGDVGIGINPKLAQRVRDSDLILAIGTRLGEMTTSGYTLLQAPNPTQKLVHIHSSAEELNRVYHADLAMMATMNAAARSLEVLDAPKDVPWQAWTAEANADYLANMQPQKLPGDIDMPAIVGVINKLLPEDAVLTNGAGNFASWVHRFHKHRGLANGHKVQLAPTSGSMGYGVPAGIAASILTGRTVFTIAGDGDFLMNGQELATAVQHGAKTIIVLLNNSVYGTIRMHQEREYPNHSSGSYLKNPSFAQLAQAYGYAGVRITRTDEFESAFKAAMERAEGTLIEVMIDEDVITTRATLTTIREAAIARLAKSK
jgi:acetolactate synthase-1/2/3 large subunit